VSHGASLNRTQKDRSPRSSIFLTLPLPNLTISFTYNQFPISFPFPNFGEGPVNSPEDRPIPVGNRYLTRAAACAIMGVGPGARPLNKGRM